jgi:hypothetical protein
MNLMDFAASVQDDRVNITKHAKKAADDDGLKLQAILNSLAHGSIIKYYLEDKPYPSCLILSWIDATIPIHSVWAYNAGSRSAVLVTVYRPNPKQWIDWTTRAKP